MTCVPITLESSYTDQDTQTFTVFVYLCAKDTLSVSWSVYSHNVQLQLKIPQQIPENRSEEGETGHYREDTIRLNTRWRGEDKGMF